MTDKVIEFGRRPAAPPPPRRLRLDDCSNAESDNRVILSADVAQLLAQAFLDLANERRIVAMDIAGAEEINRAFREIERLNRTLSI